MDSFPAKITAAASGCQVVAGWNLQVGILDREFHAIPAKTRMVMYGKSYTRAGDGQGEPAALLGFDLEIVPVALARDPKPGDLVTVRVLHKGKPIGGKNVVVVAATSGPQPPPQDSRIQTSEWSVEAMADPKTGEATFPLIVGGQHHLRVRFVDETPGMYDGERNDRSEFSHLRKGDSFERTIYMSTLTLQVGNR